MIMISADGRGVQRGRVDPAEQGHVHANARGAPRARARAIQDASAVLPVVVKTKEVDGLFNDTRSGL